MRTDTIQEVGIDQKGSLWVKPTTATFPYIYREAMEVHWDADRRCLYGPTPREASYLTWFKQIVCGAQYQGVELELKPETRWSGIDDELRHAIVAEGLMKVPKS